MQETKSDAAQAADVLNAAAATTAIAAGFLSVTPGLEPVAAVYWVASGVFWLGSIVLDELADDPPRRDYHVVSKFNPVRRDAPVSMRDSAAIINDFCNLHADLIGAMEGLLISFERVQGALADMYSDGVEANTLARVLSRQRRAAKHNALHARRSVHLMLSRGSDFNAVWRNHQNMASTSGRHTSLAERERTMKALWAVVESSLSAGVTERRLKKLRMFFEASLMKESEVPHDLLGDDWNSSMIAMERRLALISGEAS